MPSLKEVRKRITSVKNTQKITRAMKLVAAAKLKRAQDAMNELKPYATKQRELLENLAAQLGPEAVTAHPLLETREEVKKIGIVVMTSDRGMCGGFNSYINRKLASYVAERQGEGVEVVVFPLGRRANLFVKKMGYTVGKSFAEIIPPGQELDIRGITETVAAAFTSGELDEVFILSNRFKNAITQIPTVSQLFPVPQPEVEEGAATSVDLIYEPSQQALFNYVVPRYAEVQVRQAIYESITGEHAARMNAMNNATDNAQDMISRLTLEMNRARQAAITTELMEIISGAESLK
ncbi:MAG: ATP synthase F1 subunit gamma [Bradymonadia bacterium]